MTAALFGLLRTHLWILLALGQSWESSEGLAGQGGPNMAHRSLTSRRAS